MSPARSRLRIWWECKMESTLCCVFGKHHSCPEDGCQCECHYRPLLKWSTEA